MHEILWVKVYTVSECYALEPNFFVFYEVLEFKPGLVNYYYYQFYMGGYNPFLLNTTELVDSAPPTHPCITATMFSQ